ncbi:hypothetical protein [Thalassobius sp. I31.1]|uniref:hypothetical protein n=1 Tax=Thalassobius sp. I31.1 TaxID=2109912 RepID=UPI000D19DA04|nr:hypothetical protein [Thalassobius sp. I31.1]
MTDLFGYTKPRAKPRVMMHVADAGEGIRFECEKCGHDTGWIADEKSVSENKRGLPCPVCNEGDPS